jgi:hypothetical protein
MGAMNSHAPKFMSLGFAVLLGACFTETSTTGTVDMPLTSVGSDGATYRLPEGTRLTLAAEPSPFYDVALDGDAPVITFSAAEGSYQADLYNVENGYTTQWPLLRTAPDGTVSTVDATLVTAHPFTTMVVADQATALRFQFSIATGGTVTFGHGTVSVTVGVDEVPATGYSLSAQGTGDVAGIPAINGPHAAELTAALPGEGTTALSIALSARLIGPWRETGGSIDSDFMALTVCAPIELTAHVGSGHTGFADLIAEAGHGDSPGFLFGPVSFCVIDFGTYQEVRVRMSRLGPAESPTFSAITGSEPVLFWNVLRMTFMTRIYDSQAGTIDLGALTGTHDVPMRIVTRVGTDLSMLWYQSTVAGQVTFSFAGNL